MRLVGWIAIFATCVFAAPPFDASAPGGAAWVVAQAALDPARRCAPLPSHGWC